MWAEIVARALVSADADRHSVIQNAYGYGLFTGGLGIHGGAERLGASIIPISGGNTRRLLMQDFGTTHLTCTPSYAQFLGEAMNDYGIDKSKLKLRAGASTVLRPGPKTCARTSRTRSWASSASIFTDSPKYADPASPSNVKNRTACTCGKTTSFLKLSIRRQGEVLPDGEYGEPVITTIGKEGMPLIRYRTRDITCIIPEPCKCGRTHRRIARLRGRTDDMLVIRGVNVFPSQIEHALLSTGLVEPNYLITVTREGTLDKIMIQVELPESCFWL